MQLNFLNKPYFENGCINKLSSILEDEKMLNPLICTDPGLSDLGMTDQIINLLSKKINAVIYDQTPANPTENCII